MKNPWECLPQEFLKRLDRIVSSSEKISVLEQYSVAKPTTLRANTLKITPEKLKEELDKIGIGVRAVSWSNNAFIIQSLNNIRLTDLDLYKNGFFYIQSLSSMVPPLVLAPQKGEKILDICAAPGSKTTQMAAEMQNTGEIIANDNSRIRSYKLSANLKIQGVTNTKVIVSAGQSLWQQYPEYFDKSLVDVPCSMEGRFDCSDKKTYEQWSVKKIKELVSRQRFLLRSAISATKVGGVIVYSTCTLAPEENESIIDWILGKEKNKVITEDFKVEDLDTKPPLFSWNGKTYNIGITHTARILPNPLMEGFYIAKLRKIKSNVYHE
jgi:16S rRNA (cytosine1407-C5)-methyltransferase